MAKTIITVGPKCQCGYGFNTGVTLPEQADINALRDTYVANGMDPVTALALAKTNTPNAHLVHTQAREDEIKRDQLRQATFILAAHVNADGSCPGRVGEAPEKVAYDPQRAQPLDFKARLDLAEKVVQRHGGKVRNDEPSMDLAGVRAAKAKEAARVV